MNPKIPFVVTIDTEEDNAWSYSDYTTTDNAKYLSGFQQLCDRFGFKPTYLVNHAMARDPYFQQFGREVVRAGNAEIGMHLHAWNCPPFDGYVPLAQKHHVYIYEVPPELMWQKMQLMTQLLQDLFGICPNSHRAGRWGFNEGVARILVQLGYTVDCSVTPGITWRKHLGHPEGSGGPDYTGFPSTPYFLDLDDISKSGLSKSLLEVPVTIRPLYGARFMRFYKPFEYGIIGKCMRLLCGPPYLWMRPNGKNLDGILGLIEWSINTGRPLIHFMLHSSELMAGANPTFDTPLEIERLHEDLRAIFSKLKGCQVTGMTLSEFRQAQIARGGAVD